MTIKPTVLCILDGWGHSTNPTHNAIMAANTPNWDSLITNNPHSLLKTCGLDVGLPEGIMGNSEVGHMNIGSGRVVLQNLPQIDESIKKDELKNKEPIQNLITKLKNSGGTCHLIGLVSDGGVHSHISHIIELAKIMGNAEVPVLLHVLTDGRDTAPSSAKQFIEDLGDIKIATISGRYYAMDRDKRWERVKLAYDVIAKADGNKSARAIELIDNSYTNNITDEFIKPTVIGDYEGMKDGDGILMANFRSDRAREILSALLDPEFNGFERGQINFAAAAGMVEYSSEHSKFIDVVFPPQTLDNILGQVVADNGLKQLRIAETEKYAHVTFFFNGGREEKFVGEDRELIPSPKVATYDLQPEMSAAEVTTKLVAAIESEKYSLIVVNYANTDMVGHTGIEEAAINAVEAIDSCLGKLTQAVSNIGGMLLITADHGNAELMVDPNSGEAHTQHTLNEVPFILVGKGNDISLKDGRLSDIAPTVLQLMEVEQPAEMTGNSLL
jgi:2,3-bisphosphoglycerate-independent phosphoglycerate mutase